MNDTVVTQNVSRLAAELSEKKFRFKPTALFKYFSYVCAAVAVVSLVGIVAFVLIKGIPNISLHLLFGEDSVADPSIAGAIVQTFKIVVVSLVIAVPIGVGCAVYLVEYTGRGNKLVKVIKTATETLAGVPSIVFGLFGLLFFVDFLGFGRGLWAGSFTITLMILPPIITSVEESLRAVSDTYREGSFGLGATRLRTVFKVVLPSAMSGILGGIILGMGRIVSESAPLLFTAGTGSDMPTLTGSGATLAVAMYMAAATGQIDMGYAIGVVLIVLVVGLNILATVVTGALQKKQLGSR